MFVVTISFFSGITLSATPLKCVPMNKQECKVRPEIVNVNSDEPEDDKYYPQDEYQMNICVSYKC